MIVIDSSALIAVLIGEPDCDVYRRACARADILAVGAPNLLETQMVMIGRFGPPGLERVESLLRDLDVDVRPFLPDHAVLAAKAFARFGRRQHRAALNFGDCMAYALAKSLNVPLLFKGDDFSHTDIESSL